MPVGNILVGDSRRNVEHDDTALSVDVVPISKTTELLLSCGIPDIELNASVVLEYCKLAELIHSIRSRRTVVNPSGWTSTPSVAIYFFSNSPVRCRLTNVVYRSKLATITTPERSIKF